MIHIDIGGVSSGGMLHFLVFLWVGVDYLWYCPITTVLITTENQPIIKEIDTINYTTKASVFLFTQHNHNYQSACTVWALPQSSCSAVRAVSVHNTCSSTLPLTWTEVHQLSTKGRYSKHCMYCVAKIRASSSSTDVLYVQLCNCQYKISANYYGICSKW